MELVGVWFVRKWIVSGVVGDVLLVIGMIELSVYVVGMLFVSVWWYVLNVC